MVARNDGSGGVMDFLITIYAYILTFTVPFTIAYLFGSIPFGLLITKLAGKGDIREIGSGNIGATNVLRTGSKTLAFITLLLDFLKPAFAIGLLYPSLSQSPEFFTNALLIGLFAIIGHCYPVWLKFKGGKGVATTFGVLFAAVPFAGMLAALFWVMSAMAARMSSLAAISAMIAAPAFTYTFYGLYPALINTVISALVIWRHRENIARLRAGTEPKIGEKK